MDSVEYCDYLFKHDCKFYEFQWHEIVNFLKVLFYFRVENYQLMLMVLIYFDEYLCQLWM